MREDSWAAFAADEAEASLHDSSAFMMALLHQHFRRNWQVYVRPHNNSHVAQSIGDYGDLETLVQHRKPNKIFTA